MMKTDVTLDFEDCLLCFVDKDHESRYSEPRTLREVIVCKWTRFKARHLHTVFAGSNAVNAETGGFMFAEALRDAGYASYRARLNALLGIPEGADETQIPYSNYDRLRLKRSS